MLEIQIDLGNLRPKAKPAVAARLLPPFIHLRKWLLCINSIQSNEGRCTHHMQEQVPSRAVGAGGQGGLDFGRSVNPISTRRGGQNMSTRLLITPPPGFSNIPTALAFIRSYEEKKNEWVERNHFTRQVLRNLLIAPFGLHRVNEWLYQRCAAAHFISLCAKLMPLTIRKKPSKVPTFSSCKL